MAKLANKQESPRSPSPSPPFFLIGEKITDSESKFTRAANNKQVQKVAHKSIKKT